MKPEAERFAELLRRRLVTLRLLAADLEESRKAYVDLDLPAMHRHNSQQERLCTEISLIDAELRDLRKKLMGSAAEGGWGAAWDRLEAGSDPDSARQLQLLLGGLKGIQADMRRLSRVHAELLKRSRRSVNVLLNFLAHYAGTYPAHVVRPAGWSSAPPGKAEYVEPFR